MAAPLLFDAFPRSTQTLKVRSFTVEQSVHDVAVNLLGDFAAFDPKTMASCNEGFLLRELVLWVRPQE